MSDVRDRQMLLNQSISDWRGAQPRGESASSIIARIRGTTGLPTPSPTSSRPSGGTSAFDKFYNTPYYQVPLQEGYDAINANYAARGALESGAAQKALVNYGQGQASSAFRDYVGLLQGQQGVGVGATNSYVGASGAYGGNMAALASNYGAGASGAYNNYVGALGNLYAGQANAQSQYAQNVGQINSNAAVANANNTNGLVSGIGSALGGAAGYFAYQPSYSAAYGGTANYPVAQSYAYG